MNGDDAITNGKPENRFVAVTLALAAYFAIRFPLGGFRFGQQGPGILDPDSYTRLLRIEQWLSGGHWYDPSAPWANAPWGDVLHWTRLMDLLVGLVAWPLSHWVGLRGAILISGATLPVVLGALTIAILAHGSRVHLHGRGIVLLGILAALQPNFAYVFKFGYVDHHSLLIFFFAVGWAMSASLVTKASRREAILAGVAAGLGTWVSIESLSWIVSITAIFAFLWILEGDDRLARNASTFLLSAAVTSTLALLAERPPSDLLTIDADRISADHVAVLGAMAAIWLVLSRRALLAWASTRRRRIVASANAFIVPVAIVARIFPKLLRGPLADVDPRVVPLMFEHNEEVTHMTVTSLRSAAAAIVAIAPAVIAIAWAIHRFRRGTNGDRRQAVLTLGLVALFLPLTVYQWRWAPYLGVAIFLDWTLAVIAAWRRRRATTRRFARVGLAACAIALATGHVILGVGLVLAADESPQTRECSCVGLGDALASDSGVEPRDIIVMSTQFEGPQIAYEAGMRVVGTPYHRNTEGLLDTNLVMGGHDDSASRRVLAGRGVRYVVICLSGKTVSFMEQAHPDGLAARLARGDAPGWLEAVALPSNIDRDLRVYRVRQNDE